MQGNVFLVFGDSMHPTLETGDRVETVGVSRSEVRIGDIISYVNGDGRRVIHRVVRLEPLVTRGDNASEEDAPVPDESPVWRVVSVDGSHRPERMFRSR